MGIAQKEIYEVMYWLELFKETHYLYSEEYERVNIDAIEIIKLITSIKKPPKITLIINPF